MPSPPTASVWTGQDNGDDYDAGADVAEVVRADGRGGQRADDAGCGHAEVRARGVQAERHRRTEERRPTYNG